jgi:hypothetical protein
MKCKICNKELKKDDVIIKHNKVYCKRCYDKIPKEIVIYPIVPLTKYNDNKKPLLGLI